LQDYNVLFTGVKRMARPAEPGDTVVDA